MDEPRPSLVRSGGAAGAVGRLSSPSWLLLLVPAAAAVGMLAWSDGGSGHTGHTRQRRRRRVLVVEEEEQHGPMNVFALALNHMDQQEIGWMMVAVIFSQLVLDELLRRVEASVGANARACLREVYKELSTLGLISFALFLVQSFETKVNEATLEAFEYSHIFVFSFAIVYVIQSAVLIASVAPIQRRLVRLHAYGDAVAAAITSVSMGSGGNTTAVAAGPGSEEEKGRGWWWWWWWWWHCCGGGGVRDRAATRAFDGFRAFRRRFLAKHSLPPSFLMDEYLIQVYDRWVLVKLDIASWCWAFMCLIFCLHALAANFPRFSAFALNRWTFLAYGWLLLLADCALFGLVHRVHARVLRGLKGGEGLLDGDRSSIGMSASTSTNVAAVVVGGGGEEGEGEGEGGEEDALEELRRRRAALYAQYYHQQQQQQQQGKGAALDPPPLPPASLPTTTTATHAATAAAAAAAAAAASFASSSTTLAGQSGAAAAGGGAGAGLSHIHPPPLQLPPPPPLGHGDAGVLRHPPRHFGFGGGGLGGIAANLTATNGGGAQQQGSPRVAAPPDANENSSNGGFTPWETFAFNYGTEALNILRCLYLAAWLCTYAVPAFLEWFPSPGWALLYVLAIPVPAVITGTALIPRMVTRFLLVSSLSVLDLEAFDAVVEHMEECDAALKEIAALLRRLSTTAAVGDPIDASSTSTSTSRGGKAGGSGGSSRDGVERLFASLAAQHQHQHQQHPGRHALSFLPSRRRRQRVTPTSTTSSTTHLSYAQLLHFLQKNGVHLPMRRFRALVRFVDVDGCGSVDLQDFRALLEADHVFDGGRGRKGQRSGMVMTTTTTPAAARVMRLLSRQSTQGGQGARGAVEREVGRLLREGSSVLMGPAAGEEEAAAEGGGGRRVEEVI